MSLYDNHRWNPRAMAAQNWNQALTQLRAAHRLFREARKAAKHYDGPALANRKSWTAVDKALSELDEQLRVAFITARDESYSP